MPSPLRPDDLIWPPPAEDLDALEVVSTQAGGAPAPGVAPVPAQIVALDVRESPTAAFAHEEPPQQVLPAFVASSPHRTSRALVAALVVAASVTAAAWWQPWVRPAPGPGEAHVAAPPPAEDAAPASSVAAAAPATAPPPTSTPTPTPAPASARAEASAVSPAPAPPSSPSVAPPSAPPLSQRYAAAGAISAEAPPPPATDAAPSAAQLPPARSATAIGITGTSRRPGGTAEGAGVREETLVAAALQRYEAAYARLDTEAAREVWPSVDAAALGAVFAERQSQALHLERCAMDVQGTVARADCLGRSTYVRRVGSKAPQTAVRRWTFDLRKVGDEWQIAHAGVR